MRDNASLEPNDQPVTKTRRRVLKTVGAGLGVSTVATSGSSAGQSAQRPRERSVEPTSNEGTSTDDRYSSTLPSHEIAACTTITSPGTYDVVDDISSTGSQPCIEIEADDVTVRGNGHELSGDGSGIGVGVNVEATEGGSLTNRENVTVENFRVTDFRVGVHYEEVSGGRIEGLTARGNDVGVHFEYGVVDVTVRNSTLADSTTGFSTFGDPDVYGGPSGNRLERSAIESNEVGIDLGFSTTSHTFVRNRIVGNGGGARHRRVDSSGHTYENNVICSNPNFGILNEDSPPEDGIPAFEDVVRATNNYWGAANGPSSIGDPSSPFEDPVTGAPADGDGDAISESLDAGVANVRFDPYLASAPSDAGLE